MYGLRQRNGPRSSVVFCCLVFVLLFFLLLFLFEHIVNSCDLCFPFRQEATELAERPPRYALSLGSRIFARKVLTFVRGTRGRGSKYKYGRCSEKRRRGPNRVIDTGAPYHGAVG